MKKLTLILMAALLMTAASSCQKDDNDDDTTTTGNDGIYNPDKKIYKLYYWDSYDENQELRQVWNWNEKRFFLQMRR